MTIAAFVENQNEKLRATDDAEQFFLLTMEEPEAHLHPHAQRQLFDQLSRFAGQKVVSTHSPSIVAQASLMEAIYFSKRDGKTSAVRYRDTDDQDGGDQKVYREVIHARSDLLFASAVVFCEGITEELALPIFFYEYFGCAPFSLGVSIVNVGGKDNYRPFLSLVQRFDIPWFIFGDGEAAAISAVSKAVKAVFGRGVDAVSEPNIVILDNGDDYEEYLIRAGYADPMIEAIGEHEEDDAYFDRYIRTHDGMPRSGGTIRSYSHAEGRMEALIDLCHGSKAKYALDIAKKLVGQADKSKRIPPKVTQLFAALSDRIGANMADAGREER